VDSRPCGGFRDVSRQVRSVVYNSDAAPAWSSSLARPAMTFERPRRDPGGKLLSLGEAVAWTGSHRRLWRLFLLARVAGDLPAASLLHWSLSSVKGVYEHTEDNVELVQVTKLVFYNVGTCSIV
jgi:hypothetical protein